MLSRVEPLMKIIRLEKCKYSIRSLWNKFEIRVLLTDKITTDELLKALKKALDALEFKYWIITSPEEPRICFSIVAFSCKMYIELTACVPKMLIRIIARPDIIEETPSIIKEILSSI